MPDVGSLVVYDVAVDHTSLKAVGLRRKGTGYGLALTGSVDDRWVEAFRTERAGSHEFSRFDLEEGAVVSFLRGPGDGPTEIFDTLDQLDSFIARVNRRASSAPAR